MQGTEHLDRAYGRSRQLWADILGNAGESEYADLEHLSGRTHTLQFSPREMAQPQHQGFAGDRLARQLGVALELVADCGTDEVGPVGIELLRYEKIDVTEVNETEIDRDLFRSLGSSLGARGPCRS